MKITASLRLYSTVSCGFIGRGIGPTPKHLSTKAAIREGIGKTKSRSANSSSSTFFQRRQAPDSSETKYEKARPIASARGAEGTKSAVSAVNDEEKQLYKRSSIPYSSPASEFLYGRSVVEAALKARHRKLHKLYYIDDVGRSSENVSPLIKLALTRGLAIRPLRGHEATGLLDRMSKGRPHNGLILDASPLIKLPVTSLLEADPPTGSMQVSVGVQSDEEREVNGEQPFLEYQSRGSRYPFVLFLDGIIDPGNLGAIIRSASFLGVDAVVVSGHCAPLSAVVLKASAGAAETLPLFSVRKTGSFVETSRKHGWQFYAAVPPEARHDFPMKTCHTLTTLERPLLKHPCAVMLGGEGPGLWKDLILKADSLLTIQGRSIAESGLDSLNVSAASALITNAFMSATFSTESEMWT